MKFRSFADVTLLLVGGVVACTPPAPSTSEGQPSTGVPTSSAPPTAETRRFVSFEAWVLSSVCDEKLNGCGETISVVTGLEVYDHKDTYPSPVYALSEEEMDHLQEVVASKEVQDAFANRKSCDDELGGAVFAQFAIKYPGEETAHWLKGQADCVFADRTAVPDDHVIRRLYRELESLKEKHYVCPPWVDPGGPLEKLDLSTFELPMGYSCYLCGGRCPEGDRFAAAAALSAPAPVSTDFSEIDEP
jgi:hypothetical protein